MRRWGQLDPDEVIRLGLARDALVQSVGSGLTTLNFDAVIRRSPMDGFEILARIHAA